MEIPPKIHAEALTQIPFDHDSGSGRESFFACFPDTRGRIALPMAEPASLSDPNLINNSDVTANNFVGINTLRSC